MASKKSYTVQEALHKLSRYCVYQDRCHKEVEEKLMSMDMIPEARAKIISDLIKDDFLNEQRFALNYAKGKFNQKHWGRNRIKIELKRKQITQKLIDKAIAQITENDYQNKLSFLAEKKYKQIGNTNSLSNKQKLKNYLLYKGYELHLIYEEINKLTNL